MDRMPLSYTPDYNNRFYRPSIYDRHSTLLLKLNYTDSESSVELHDFIEFSLSDTIRKIKKKLQRLFPVKYIDPDQVILTEISYAGQCYLIPSFHDYKTLEELRVMNESMLYFKRQTAFSPSKPSTLTVSFISAGKRITIEWNESRTTIDNLMNTVISAFDLSSIDRNRIQLRTYFDNILNMPNNLGKKLTDLGIRNDSLIFLYILTSTSNVTDDDEIFVYIKNNSGEEDLVLASSTDTIGDLEAQIKSKYKDSSSLSFHDAEHHSIDASNFTRTLRELGIRAKQAIYVDVKETLSSKNTASSQVLSSLSSSSAVNSETVTVDCQFSNHKSKTIQVPVRYTVAELTVTIGALRENQTLANFILWSDSITIDDNQPDKYLTDFGIKPGDTIHAYVNDVIPTNNLVKTNEINNKTYSTTVNVNLNEKPKGLDNLGNTCFMNSALQCLIHVSALTDFFMNILTQVYSMDDHVNNYNPFNQYGKLTEAYAELVWNLKRSNHKSYSSLYSYYDYSFQPIRFKNIIGQFEPRFATFDQQDAQEFMTFLLDTIHGEIKQNNAGVQQTIITDLFFFEIKSLITCSKCQHVSTKVDINSILPLSLNSQERLFEVNFIRLNGQEENDRFLMPISSRIEHLVYAFFERRYITSKFSYVTAMTSNIKGAIDFDTPLNKLAKPTVTLIEQREYNGRMSTFRYGNESITLKLDECIQEFFSSEMLDSSSLCEQNGCKQSTNASKQLQLLTFPRVLIIQFKRFSHQNGFRQKLDTFVDYPIDGFDLGKILKSSQKAVYDLIAVCNHIGSIYCGHYTAYARKDPKQDTWYRFNDSFVSVVYYKEDLVSKDAYLLFYLKR